MGGRKARAAPIRLISLATEPNAKSAMSSAGVKSSAAKLMKSAASSTELQGLAGSVITLLTGLPVTSELSDDKTGSDGVINIVMPRPSRIYAPDRAMVSMLADKSTE